ncbi:MAG: hypothetical protein ACJ73L_12780 [Actinomycetes bacterium]
MPAQMVTPVPAMASPGMMPAAMMPSMAVPSATSASSSPAHVVDFNVVQITGSNRRRISLIRRREVQFGWLGGRPTCNGRECSQ